MKTLKLLILTVIALCALSFSAIAKSPPNSAKQNPAAVLPSNKQTFFLQKFTNFAALKECLLSNKNLTAEYQFNPTFIKPVFPDYFGEPPEIVKLE